MEDDNYNEKEHLIECVSGFKEKDILVIGDIMLDKYIKGNVKRINPEAPVPILERASEEYRIGGAANIRNISNF
jgi:bifunctional ADP-heptose synthase (sugar kinase/adenylyltransferase)